MFVARGLHKAYAGPVLNGIELELASGTVHALVGANGAGKSTLARILSGLSAPDAGKMTLDGKDYAPTDRASSRARGVSIVLQELHLIETLTVGENLFLHDLPSKAGWVDRASLARRSRQRLERVGFPPELSERAVGLLGVGQRQLVAIARALSEECRLLILDEPTAALTEYQTEKLFEEIESFRKRGVAILYISHRLEELSRVADFVTVVRDGRIVHQSKMNEISTKRLIEAMSSNEDSPDRPPSPDNTVEREGSVLSVRELSSDGVHNVSFELDYGEILGVFGLVGAGRTELLRAVYGANTRTGGSVALVAEDRRATPSTPAESVRAGMVMLPEDRKLEGLLLSRGLVENTVLGLPTGRSGWSFRRESDERDKALGVVEQLSVQCATLEQPVSELSGGNQQKLLIGRCDLHQARVLLLDEPTRGIDVSSRRLIHDVVREWASSGKSIVVVSSELAELMELCDRIGVIASGRWVGEFARDTWSQAEILAAALSWDDGPEDGDG